MVEHCDVVVVGGGVAGCSAAFHLARLGVAVALLEAETVGGGATGDAVGVLYPPLRQPYHEIERFRGPLVAKQIWSFASRSVEGLTDLLSARGAGAATELDLNGATVLAEPATEHVVRGAFLALARAGFQVAWIDRNEARRRAGGGRGFLGGYRVERGGALDPARASRALAEAAASAGAHVTEGTRVSRVRADASGFVVESDGACLSCQAVVYAAHLASTELVHELADTVLPIRAQAFTTAPLPMRFEGAFATDWKLNVWRQAPDGRLIVGGWRHDAFDRAWGRRGGVDRHLQRDVRAWFEASFPDLAPLPVEREWGGVIGWTADSLPLVGPIPGRSGEWILTGFSGGGLPFVYEAARALAHAMAGGESVPGAQLMDPRRFGF